MQVTDEPTGAQATDILPVIGVAPVVVAMAAWPAAGGALDTIAWLSTFAAFGAVVGGIPAVSWALEHDKRRLWHWLLLGVVAALVPMLAALVSGLLGHWLLGRARYAAWVASVGAPLPVVGVMRWTTFGWWLVGAAGLGAVVGLVYWLLMVERRRPRWLSLVLVAAVVGAAAGVAALIR